MQQFAVIQGKWLTNQQFLDGLAIGSILPSPLVIFTTFVGYIGGNWYGAILMTLGMFIPAFSFTIVGHNLFEKAVKNKTISACLDGVTAAVIGIVAVSAAEMLRSAVLNVQQGMLFTVTLFALYQFQHKYLSVIIVILAAVAGQVLFRT